MHTIKLKAFSKKGKLLTPMSLEVVGKCAADVESKLTELLVACDEALSDAVGYLIADHYYPSGAVSSEKICKSQQFGWCDA